MSIVDKEVRARQGRTALMQREASGLHPSWRLRHTLNQENEGTYRDGPNKKMLINDVGSRNVYENKQNKDNMPDKMSGICAWLKAILQEITAYDRQFTVKKQEAAALFCLLTPVS
jgi:hypothetical protein